MHVAVIIPAFNVAPFLSDAIDSVLRQSHADWSLIVIDDGSTDGTDEIAGRYRHPRLRVIRQVNAGVSAARNVGLRAAQGLCPDAVLFLDGDDWLGPNGLSVMIAALECTPDAVAAVGRWSRVTANGVAGLSRRTPAGRLLEFLIIGNLFANGGHLLIRWNAVEKAGFFRNDLTYGEDWEYWTRLALLGPFVGVPSRLPVLFVRERAGSAYLSRATDPAAYRAAAAVIDANPMIVEQIGPDRLGTLAKRRDAETAWAIGRELIRHGRWIDGNRWLERSIRGAPSMKRVMLAGFAWLGLGPFKPYRTIS